MVLKLVTNESLKEDPLFKNMDWTLNHKQMRIESHIKTIILLKDEIREIHKGLTKEEKDRYKKWLEIIWKLLK